MESALLKFKKEVKITPGTNSELFKNYYQAFLSSYQKMRIGYWEMKNEAIQVSFTSKLNEISKNDFLNMLNIIDGIPDISKTYEIKYISMEVRIVDFDTEHEQNNLIILSMMTDSYLLMDNLNDKLLISPKENKESYMTGNNVKDSYFIELPKDVTIYSYQRLKQTSIQ